MLNFILLRMQNFDVGDSWLRILYSEDVMGKSVSPAGLPAGCQSLHEANAVPLGPTSKPDPFQVLNDMWIRALLL